MKLQRYMLIMLSVLIMISGISGCTSNSMTGKVDFDTAKSESDAQWKNAEGESIILNNQFLTFEMDTATTHFEITNLATGKKYTSVPQGETLTFSQENANRINSEVTISYYHQQSTEQFMHSDKDSVLNNNFEIKYKDNVIRVFYTMSESKDTIFSPEVFMKSDFEKLVLDKLNPNEARRISGYYTLYSNDEKPKDFSEKQKKYPALKKNPLYIINDEVNETAKQEITEFMATAGYVRSQYDAIVKKLDITLNEEVKPGFVIPVEYRITEDGFSAAVLTDLISENSQEYKLQKIDLLEYFAATPANVVGNYIVPDGSGMLINLNSNNKSDYSKSFYGNDSAVQAAYKKQIESNIMLPVFGISETDGGVLAIIESAAEMAQLNVKTVSNAAPLNHIYTSFIMRSMDVTNIGEKMHIPVFNLFAGHLLKTSPKIRYVLFNPDNCGYISMAEYYRNFLLENDALNQVDQNDKMPFYVDYLCMLTRRNSILGVPYDEKIVLSTISEIYSSVQALNEAGIDNIVLRLKGYGSGGLDNKAYNRFEIDRKIGTRDELLKLKKLLEKGGGKLVLDADFRFVYTKGNNYNTKKHSAHYLNKNLVYSSNYDIVSRQYTGDTTRRYSVSPLWYEDFVLKYIRTLKKSFGDNYKNVGLSYGSVGLYLGSDFGTKADLDRIMSLDLTTAAISKATETNKYIMFDNGNVYTLSHASALRDVPNNSSGSDIEYEQIPFYQTVIHGSIPYSGVSSNISSIPENNYLNSVEYGGVMSYTWITRDNSLLTNTDYSKMLYSLNDKEHIAEAISQYKSLEEYYSATYKALIKSYERVAPGVFLTSYDNGTRVIVNYNENDYHNGQITVGAKSFCVMS